MAPKPGLALAVVTALFLVTGLATGYGGASTISFPEAHKEFLGGGSYAALFGRDAALDRLTAPLTQTSVSPASGRVLFNVRVNAPQAGFPLGLLGRSETALATSPNGKNLVAGWNDAQGFCGPPFGVPCVPQVPFNGLSGYGYSTNGGVTWTDGGAPPTFDNVFTRGDPWLDRGGFDDETYYYANLAIHALTGAGLGISVHRGHFVGGTFAWEDVRTFNAPNAPDDFYDKEALAMAKGGSGSGVVTLTNFIEVCNIAAFGFGQIEAWRTADGGETWMGPAIVSPDVTFITDPADPQCGFTGVLQQSSAPAVGPDGSLYVVWQFGPTFASAGVSTGAEIRFSRSVDGGATWSSPMTVAAINSMRQNAPVGYNRSRINDHPRIAVAQSGAFAGRIYVTYYSAVVPVKPAPVIPCPPGSPAGSVCIAQHAISSQVFVKFSDDGGVTWSAAIPLAPAPPLKGLKRWWPSISVDADGRVDVVYYESREQGITPDPADSECNVGLGGVLRRAGPRRSLVDTYWVSSRTGGATWSHAHRMSTVTSGWCTTVSNIRPNFGDYIFSASAQGVHGLWADGRNGIPDVFFGRGLP